MEEVGYKMFLEGDSLNKCWVIQVDWKEHSSIFFYYRISVLKFKEVCANMPS